MKLNTATHLEIPVTDLDKAKEFFSTIFDWGKVWQGWNESYALVSPNGDDLSFGIFKVDEVKPSQIIITIEVEDIDKLLVLITKNGGSTTREKYEIDPSVGFAANFKDPFGNTWGLHSAPKNPRYQ